MAQKSLTERVAALVEAIRAERELLEVDGDAADEADLKQAETHLSSWLGRREN